MYSNVSDKAIRYALQQIQPIAIWDLKDTRAYAKLEEAYHVGKDLLRLVSQLSCKIDDIPLQLS